MAGKYFTTTIKPTIAASIQHLGNFADGDALFDWTAFNIPKGAAKLLNVTAIIRGTDGSAQTFAMDLFFAKTFQGTAPGSLGTLHATANGTGYYNHLLSTWKIEEADYIGTSQLDSGPNISTTSNALTTVGPIPVVLQGEPESGSNVGYDKLYVAATTPDGTANFSTAVETTGAHDVSGLSTTSIGSLDDGSGGSAAATTKFAIGDIIHAEDDIILGEVATVATAALTFKTDGSKQYHAGGETLFSNPATFAAWQVQNGADAAGDLADGDELYNLHPITLILHWEK